MVPMDEIGKRFPELVAVYASTQYTGVFMSPASPAPSRDCPRRGTARTTRSHTSTNRDKWLSIYDR